MAKTNCNCVCHKLGYIYCGPGYCPDHETVETNAQPERTTCPDCGGDGSHGNDCTCPGWQSVDEMPIADLKAMLATDGLSVNPTKQYADADIELAAAAAEHAYGAWDSWEDVVRAVITALSGAEGV